MFNQDEITKEDHSIWCTKKIYSHNKSEDSYIVTSKKDNCVVGFFRYWFDREYGAGNWSMFTDIRDQKFGLGIFCEVTALDMFFSSRFNKTNEIIAEVNIHNHILSLHKKLGFEITVQKEDKIVIMRNTRKRYAANRCKIEGVLERIDSLWQNKHA